MRYVTVPREINIHDLRANESIFSPGRYVKFEPPGHITASHFAPLDKLSVLRDERVKAIKGEWYYYAEIGDVEVTTGGISFQYMPGYYLPNKMPSKVSSGDILISTVRTYRKGIGMVTLDAGNMVTTNAFLNICGVTDYAPGLTPLYLYSFLRSDFFVEQVWAMLNRGVYPRMDKGALDKILIPIPSDKRVIDYVSALMQAVIEKVKMIQMRHAAMLKTIGDEITNNQNTNKFIYAFPSQAEIASTTRMDAGFWSEPLRREIHALKNYRYGAYQSIYDAGYTTRRGPNLAVSVVGPGHYYNKPTGIAKPLATPGDLTDYMTISQFRFYGNRRGVDCVRQGEVMFGAKGMREVSIGHTYVHLAEEPFVTNFDAFLIDSGNHINNIVLGQLFNYCKVKGVFGRLSDTSNGGSFVQNYFDHLPIPKFPDEVKATIAALYHNPTPHPTLPPKLSTFVEWHRNWNEQLGIWELDREMKSLLATLRDVQDKIIRGQTVMVPFN